MTPERGFQNDDGGQTAPLPGHVPSSATPQDRLDELPPGPVLFDPQPDGPTRLNIGWAPAVITVSQPRAGAATYLVAGLSLLVASWAILSLVSFVLAQLERSAALGTVAAVLITASSVLIGYAALTEWRAYRSLQNVKTLRITLMADDTAVDAMRTAARAWLARISGSFADAGAVELALQAATSGLEVRALIRSRMAEPLMLSATKIGQQAALQGAALLAICPHPTWDGVIAGGRALLVLRQVAALYGVRPGFAVTMVLIRHVGWTAASTAGISVVSQNLANVLLEKLPVLKHIAGAVPETSAAAFRLYRLARITAEACCPVPD